MQCTNHLKQFGTGVHNFVSTYSKLPANCVHASRPSIFVLLFPFTEQQSLYDFLVSPDMENAMVLPAADDSLRYYAWWDSLTTAEQEMTGSVPFVKCPTRRSGIQLTTTFDATQTPALGPCADYAIPTILNIPSGQSANLTATPYSWHNNYESSAAGTAATPHSVSAFYGPFRPPRRPSGGNLNNIVFRDDFGYWADGSSNQLIMGEKHIPMNRQRECFTTWYRQGDCSYLMSNGRCSNSVMRLMYVDWRLARGPNEYMGDDDAESSLLGYGFGSYHPGTCNFLLGDGSVRGVSVTVSMADILCPLTHVSDGKSVSLP